MRIEKRGGRDCLIDAPEETNDCAEISKDGFPCCYHVDGEHVSVGGYDEPGIEPILDRWLIVDVPAQAPRILTPAEVRAAQVPYVAKEIERINAGLAMGVRSFSVNAPLFEEIKRGLWTAEWSVNGAVTMDGRTSFVVRVREEER